MCINKVTSANMTSYTLVDIRHHSIEWWLRWRWTCNLIFVNHCVDIRTICCCWCSWRRGWEGLRVIGDEHVISRHAQSLSTCQTRSRVCLHAWTDNRSSWALAIQPMQRLSTNVKRRNALYEGTELWAWEGVAARRRQRGGDLLCLLCAVVVVGCCLMTADA